MEKRIDLTNGSIVSTLVSLALPIMGTSFIQMAYNMTDMIWVWLKTLVLSVLWLFVLYLTTF